MAYGTGVAVTQLAFYSGASFGNDQYSEVVIGVHNQEGISVRASGTGGSRNCYYAQAFSAFGWELYKIVAGTETSLANDFGGGSAVFAATDVIRLEVTGTTLTLKKNGSTLTMTTDGALASGSPGVMSFDASGRLDSWEGGDFGGGQPLLRRFGGTPFVGGQGVNAGARPGSGRMWGRTRSGLVVPQRFQEAA